MTTLIGANDVLRLVTDSAATLDVVALFSTLSGGVTTRGKQRTAISSATTTTIVAAPGSGNERVVYNIAIRNRHASLSCRVTVQDHDGSTAFERFSLILGPGEQAVHDGITGWEVFTAQGFPKVAQSLGVQPVAVGVMNVVPLASDVVNNNAVANTMQDVTGLSFPVVAGETYQFEFSIDYTAAATTTGSRWGLNGPSFSRLVVDSSYGLTATSKTQGQAVAYDQPAAANASSPFTTGNFAFLIGTITPSVDGAVIARFASEIAGSAITAKAGSLLKWMRTK